ncbi:MAG: Dethiobiotin synthetase [Microcoleaceae cyanobacterium]
MDYKTAYQLVLDQGKALETQKDPDALLSRLQKGQSPIPGQLTNILLALKILFDCLKTESKFDREFSAALHQLAMESYRQFVTGRERGVAWPPLLQEDLNRVAAAVQSIFSGQWQEEA